MSIDILRSRYFKSQNDKIIKIIEGDSEKDDFDMSDFIKSVIK